MNNLFAWLKSIFNKPAAYLQYRRFGIFRELTSFELYLLHNLVHSRSFKAGEMLFEKDYPMEVIYFIEKGEIQLSPAVDTSITHKVGKNQILGLWDMFGAGKRNSTASAITDVSALAITRSDFWVYIHDRPKTGIKVLKAISEEIVKDALTLYTMDR